MLGLTRIRERLRELDVVTRDVLIFCLGFGFLRFWAVYARPTVRFPDSLSYFPINFLGGAQRLWTVPLVYSALPSDGVRVVFQILVGVLCWSTLALVVSRTCRTGWVARIGALLVLLLGLCYQVVEWDQIILSESFAVSLTVLVVAALLWLWLRRSPGLVVFLFVVVMLWAFVRHVQAGIYVLIGTVVIAWALARGWRRLRVVAAVSAFALLGVWAGYAVSQSTGERTFSAYDVLVIRILKTPEGVAFFKSHGMPDVSILAKEAAENKFLGGGSPVFRDPRWTTWVEHHWVWTYADFLLTHPGAALRVPLADASANLSYEAPYGSPRPVLPSPVQDAIFERLSGDIPLWIGVIVVLGLISLRRTRPSSLDAIGALLFLATVVFYLVVYHNVASELPRTLIEVDALLRVSFVILVVASLDRIGMRRRAVQPVGIT